MPGPVYSAGYAPYGYGYRAGYAPYAASYAPYSANYVGYGSQVGCSTCAPSCGGSCGTFGSTTVNYLGGINLGCGSGNCGAVNCIPDSNITNRPVPDKLDDVRPSDRTYEGDSNREDGISDKDWAADRERRLRELEDRSRAGNGAPEDDFSGTGGGLSGEGDDWRNRGTSGSGSDLNSDGMFGTEGDGLGTYRNGNKPPMDEPKTFGSEGTGDESDVINRGANKPPMSDPLGTDGEAAPESPEEGEGDLLAPEPPNPTARRNSNLFFASHRELRSSHSEVRSRQRLAGGRQGNSRTTQISNNKGRSKAPRWISLPMPVGQARL